jgi:hypothetical protein
VAIPGTRAWLLPEEQANCDYSGRSAKREPRKKTNLFLDESVWKRGGVSLWIGKEGRIALLDVFDRADSTAEPWQDTEACKDSNHALGVGIFEANNQRDPA